MWMEEFPTVHAVTFDSVPMEYGIALGCKSLNPFLFCKNRM